MFMIGELDAFVFMTSANQSVCAVSCNQCCIDFSNYRVPKKFFVFAEETEL